MTKGNPNVGDPHFDAANGILRNLRGLTNQALLDRFERRQALRALIDLEINPVHEKFDQAHLQAIHRRIFEKVYPWAGELRQVNIARPGSYPFALVQFMQVNLDRTFASLASEGRLKTLSLASFADRAAFYMGELNTLHPFREDNGRTLREFIRELAAEAGFKIDWSRVTQEQMYEASSLSHNLGKSSGLAAVIRSALDSPQTRPKP
jgi:cell filamentation protein